MAPILCLAMFCEVHGATPIIACEGAPVPCSSCFDDKSSKSERRSSITQALSNPPIKPSDPSRTQPISIQKSRTRGASISNQPGDIATPPESPRISTRPRLRDSSFYKTYDDDDQKRAMPCANCALTMPDPVKDQLAGGRPQDQRFGPLIRSRVPYERVSLDGYTSPSTSLSTSTSSQSASNSPHPSRTPMTSTISSLNNTDSTTSVTAHNHVILFTSSHQPQSTHSCSAIRKTCLRIFSREQLPPTASSAECFSPTPPTAPYATLGRSGSHTSTGFYHSPTPVPLNVGSATLSAPSTASSGPLFFGDPVTGYTTAFVFRITDQQARGKVRRYTFICWTPPSGRHAERRAVAVFNFLCDEFRELVMWIQGLVEVESNRVDAAVISGGVATPANASRAPQSTIGKGIAAATGSHSMYGRRGSSDVSGMSTGTNLRTSFGSESGNKFSNSRAGAFGGGSGAGGGAGSSLGSGRSLGGGGFGGGGAWTGTTERGLAELVGRPDFFLDLHARFVQLSARLVGLGLA